MFKGSINEKFDTFAKGAANVDVLTMLIIYILAGAFATVAAESTGVIGSAISFDPTRPVYGDYEGNVGLGYYTWMNGGKPITLAALSGLLALLVPLVAGWAVEAIGTGPGAADLT